jgi:hypothetical protein
MMDFAVISMARSMSRWLSVALSYNGNTCYHDISLDPSAPYEAGRKNVGTCDTGMVIEAKRRIVVLREPDECIASIAENYGIENEALSVAVHDRFKQLNDLDEKTYWFDELKTPSTIKEIQEFLIGESMSISEIKTLLAAKITVSREYLEQRIGETLCLGLK